ncbi:MAG: FHA domain-containing protein [Anaerolineae bacterium]|nr:FHA domain-containing protein [Anaerolineae bacterium]
MNTAHYVLQIWRDHLCSDEYPLSKASLTLGRQGDNDIIFDDPKVSGHHAKITLRAEGVFITDTGSKNGSRLNGQPLPPHTPIPLQPGAVINIGAFSLGLRTVTSDKPAPPPITERVKISTQPQPGVALYNGAQISKYPLQQPAVTLGRAPDNTIVIKHPKVSGHHARLQQRPEGYEVIDLDSANGTYYNGQRITRKVLADGDVVYLSQDVAVQFRAHLGLLPVVKEVTEPKKPAPPPAKSLDLQGQQVIKIGRASNNDIILEHPQISRYHAMLERMGGRYRLRDLKSSNGVFVNKEKVENEAWLKEGDEIGVGPYRLIFAEDGIQQLTDAGLRLDAFDLQKWVRKDLNLLQNIYLSIHPGEFVALVGLSGAGKSTLMDAINGFRPATHGTVLVNGDDLYENFDLYRNDMGYVPQQDIVHKELTVYDALDYAAQLRMTTDTTPEERHKRVTEVIQQLDLAERYDVPISKLSGGQLKRVSIGVELLTKPRLFFLDEPTSGLDPGTEHKMMKLMRELADQGRTIMLITHATKNVMLCDKVIILVRGGYLAYYGPPEDALTYFDNFRTSEERRIKDMEFDDIYAILQDKTRGTPKQWAEAYRSSTIYKENIVARLHDQKRVHAGAQQDEAKPPSPLKATTTIATSNARKRVSALRQLAILSSRNVRIMLQDKPTLIMMLALSPLLGLMDLIWGKQLFDPVEGNTQRMIMMLFVSSIITFLVGSLSSVREIVKETDIYKRERAINLKITPYVLSKVWVGILLALYQAAVLLVFKIILTIPPGTLPAGDGAYFPFYITLFLGTLAGYMLGLAVSAGAPNANTAMLILIAVVVPQIVFAGALFPLKETPGRKVISPLMSNRWTFEALINITGIGDILIDDPCWDNRQQEDSEDETGWETLLQEDNATKQDEGCLCMGTNIFDDCRSFPGILSEEFYTEEAQEALDSQEPPKPDQPEDPTQQEAYQEDMDNWIEEKSKWERDRQKAVSGAEGILKNMFDRYDYAFHGKPEARWATLGGLNLALFIMIIGFQKRKDVV